MPAKRAAIATIVLAIVGLAISGVIANVHAELERSTGYASFCNVNESVNCDVVLSSDYADLAGVPLHVWAILNYLGFAAGAAATLFAKRVTQRRRLAGATFLLAVWGAVFSAYLATVSLGVLHAICLMCSGLYLTQVGLLVSTWLLFAAVRAEGRGAAAQRASWKTRTRFVLGASAAAILAFLALASWEATGGGGAMNADELAQRDPDFYRWYTSLPVVDFDDAGGHRKGEDGRVVVVEFSDFECGHCAKAYRTLKQVLPRFHRDVTLIFHHFPLNSSCNPAVQGPFHRYACLAAMASECAADQGEFWAYHDLLFANQSALDRDSLLRYAERLGLDREKFLACLGSDRARRRVEDDVREGTRLGVSSTPTFFLNGRMVSGALDRAKLEHAIRIERAAVAAAS